MRQSLDDDSGINDFCRICSRTQRGHFGAKAMQCAYRPSYFSPLLCLYCACPISIFNRTRIGQDDNGNAVISNVCMPCCRNGETLDHPLPEMRLYAL